MNWVEKSWQFFFGFWPKTHSYLMDDGSEDKEVKDTKTYVIKRKIKFENYQHCLKANELENKINCLEKNEIEIDLVQKGS